MGPRLSLSAQLASGVAALEDAPEISFSDAPKLMNGAVQSVLSVLRGNEQAVKTVLAAVFAGGHVLLEDVPGVGKTTLARAVARALGFSYSRIQFTADMLPSDVLGVQVFDQGRGEFSFKPGPIFAQMVLADEINRASPKTQSAMLEAMAEGVVTADGTTHPLPSLFSVLATQNPVEHHGAFPLPESQLDRFMVRVSLGYPPAEDERQLLMAPLGPEQHLLALENVINPPTVAAIGQLVWKVELAPPIADYILALVEATRRHPDVILGCSPRGSMAYATVCRAWALMAGRNYVLPDDVKDLAAAVFAHRLVIAHGDGAGSRQRTATVVDDLLHNTPVPR